MIITIIVVIILKLPPDAQDCSSHGRFPVVYNIAGH